MTQATFTQNPGELEVRITGHAGYAPGGKDIVCAACSTLAWAFLRLFCRLEEAGEIVIAKGEEDEILA